MEATAVLDGPTSSLRPTIQMDDIERKLERVLGTLIDYRIKRHLISIPDGLSKLGQGGYGDVWFGVQTLENAGDEDNGPVVTREVAVKTLRQTSLRTKPERTLTACQLARELKVWAGLLHRNILELVGFYLSDTLDDAWLLSPYEPRGNLAAFIEKQKPDQENKLELVFDVVCGLRYLHSHRPTIVHGDLKPENIIVGRDGFAKLCDFGLAKAPEEPTGLTNAGPAQGTTRYMSPELVDDDNATATVASDIWAFACVAGEVFTGHAPYHWVKGQSRILLQIAKGKIPIPLGPFSLPTELEVWIMTCWSSEPSERPSVSDCVDSLRRHMSATFPDSVRLLQANDLSLAAVPLQTDDFFVELHREKLRKQTTDHPEYAMTLTNLAFTLTERFEAEKKQGDIDEAVVLHRQALGLRPDGHPDRQSTLISLGVVLFKRYKLSDDIKDLDEMVTLFREALNPVPADYSDRSQHLTNLAVVLSLSSSRTLDRGASDECIFLYREAVYLQPVGHPNRSLKLSDLAWALSERFETFGDDPKDLEEAIEARQEVLGLYPVGHPERATNLNGLAFALISRSTTYGDVKDAAEGVKLMREGLQLHPTHDPDHNQNLHNVGWSLFMRFELLGEDGDLEEALVFLRESLKLYSPSDPERKLILGSVGGALRSSFQRHGNPEDLAEAIDLLRGAVELLRVGDFRHAEIVQNLGTALMNAFQSTGEAKDIDEAIKFHRQALQLRPGRHAFRFDSLLALGKSLRVRGGAGDLEEAKQLYTEALELVYGDTPGNLRRQVMVKSLLDNMEDTVLAAGEESTTVARQLQQMTLNKGEPKD